MEMLVKKVHFYVKVTSVVFNKKWFVAIVFTRRFNINLWFAENLNFHFFFG